MRKEAFVIRGQNAGDGSADSIEKLNFSGFKPGYAYRLTEFKLYPTTNIGGTYNECFGSITAGKTAISPIDPNFNDEALIAVSMFNYSAATSGFNGQGYEVINDTFLITQDLILMVQETGGIPVNWQCKFEPVKMTKAEEAVTNYKQFTISDE